MAERKGSKLLLYSSVKVILNNGIDPETGKPSYVQRNMLYVNRRNKNLVNVHDSVQAIFSLVDMDIERIQIIDGSGIYGDGGIWGY